jgi:hypothetical protein
MLKRILAACAALFAGLALAGPAAAWSEAAHRTIADIAYGRLTPEARRAVDALLADATLLGETGCPSATLAEAAVFVDCVDGIRRYNDLRRLHYEEAPLCGAPDKADYCKDGRCVSEAVKRAAAVLADPLALPADKLFALQQLAHFIGDLHQPFAMVDNRDDRGADIRVSLPGSSDRRLNLNGVWENTLPALAVGSGELGARFIDPLAANNETAWSRGTVDEWANETHMLARALYERLPERPECGRRPRNTEILDRGYVLSGVNTVREQVAKAGLRLAAVLNATLR